MRSFFAINTNENTLITLNHILDEFEDIYETQKMLLNYDLIQKVLETKNQVLKMKNSIQTWLDNPNLESLPPVK